MEPAAFPLPIGEIPTEPLQQVLLHAGFAHAKQSVLAPAVYPGQGFAQSTSH